MKNKRQKLAPTIVELTEILYLALAEPIGMELAVSDFDLARNRLYAARRAALDPDLDFLQFRASPWNPGTGLVICKGLAPSAKAKARERQVEVELL